MELVVLAFSLFVLGGPAAEGSDAPVPTATLETYKAARQQLDQAMRAKAVVYADVPKGLQQEIERSNTAYSAADFATAVKALEGPTAWAVAVVIDKTFVAEKFGRGTSAARSFLRSPQLSEEQNKSILARLDKAAEALNAEQVDVTNGLLNELFDFLKTLPAPEPAKAPAPEP